jgi:hypothetical protein
MNESFEFKSVTRETDNVATLAHVNLTLEAIRAEADKILAEAVTQPDTSRTIPDSVVSTLHAYAKQELPFVIVTSFPKEGEYFKGLSTEESQSIAKIATSEAETIAMVSEALARQDQLADPASTDN